MASKTKKLEYIREHKKSTKGKKRKAAFLLRGKICLSCSMHERKMPITLPGQLKTLSQLSWEYR